MKEHYKDIPILFILSLFDKIRYCRRKIDEGSQTEMDYKDRQTVRQMKTKGSRLVLGGWGLNKGKREKKQNKNSCCKLQ